MNEYEYEQESAQSLAAFMREAVAPAENFKIVVSNRIKDANGKPLEWILKKLSAEEISKIMKRNERWKQVKMPGEKAPRSVKEVDTMLVTADLIVSTIVFPNLHNEELQNSWGASDAQSLLKVMLTSEEYTRLADYCLPKSAAEMEEEFNKDVKNSED